MSELVDFLRARLDKDESLAIQAKDNPVRDVQIYGHGSGLWAIFYMEFDPDRMLREVTGKRRIVDEIARGVEYEAEPLADGVLLSLAEPYVDHPDYRPEWAPTAPAGS